MSERTFDDFDEFANDYRSIHTANIKLSGADSFYFSEHKIGLLKEQEPANNLSLLDVGCGDGATEFFLHKHLPSWKSTGIDVSEKSIAAATNKNIATASFRVFNGATIPFTGASFDIVFMAAVLHHIDFSLHAALLKEVHRVLKPGGRFYLFEHNPLNPFTRYLVKTCDFDKDACLLSHWYARQLLRNASFDSVSVTFILFFPRKGMLSKLIRWEKALRWLPAGGQYFYRCIKK